MANVLITGANRGIGLELAKLYAARGDSVTGVCRETCDELVRIPMYGSVESLNVSVASGLCLFEARRQRTVQA